jgi:hypothetical protein
VNVLEVNSRVRAVKRRVRCARRGHYWLQRMDANMNVEIFCRRCGRIDTSFNRVSRLNTHRSP